MPFRRSKSPEKTQAQRPPNPRCIPLPSKPPTQMKDWEALNADMANAFLLDIRRVQQYAKDGKVKSHESIYTGIAGIAFMEYHLAKMKLPLNNEILGSKNLLAVADKNLAKVLYYNPINFKSMFSPTRLSFVETFIGIAALVLVRGPTTAEQIIVDNFHAAKEYLQFAVRMTLASDDEGYTPGDKEDDCEVLYGRAGLLYAVLYLRNGLETCPPEEKAAVDDLISDKTLSRLVDSIMDRGRHGAHLLSTEVRTSEASRLPPLMWTWHGKRYLGGAHGAAGILQMILRCPIPLIHKHLPDILKTVRWLTSVQDESGNWPSKAPVQRRVSADNELVQWCHGAPGMVILLSTTLRVISTHEGVVKVDDATIDKLYKSLMLGADLIYKEGLSRKGVGLCHGVSGNVYALLAACDILDTSSASPRTSRILGFASTSQAESPINRRRYFTKAAHLAFLGKFHDDRTVLPGMGKPDYPWSLYEGVAGICSAWAEILTRMDTRSPRRDKSGFPGFDDL